MGIDVYDDDFVQDVLTLLATDEAQGIDAQDQCSDDGTCLNDTLSTSSVEDHKRRTRKRPSPIPRDSNRSRLERRYEVWSLREQVAALEARLRELQLQAEARDQSEKRAPPNDTGVLTRHAVAKCQHDRLVMAENERTKQQKYIRKYKSTIKRVETLLQTFPMDLIGNDLGLPFTAALGFQAVDRFEEISRGVSSMYLQLEGIFNDPRFQTSIDGVHDFRVQNDPMLRKSFEVLESRLLPFSIQATAAAMSYFLQLKKKDVVLKSRETPHTIRRTFVFSVDTPARKFQAVGQVEGRWFVEHDRVVFLQHAEFDQLKRITGWVPEGYVIRQFRWTVLRSPRNEELRQSTRATCQFERFEVVIPVKKSSTEELVRDHDALKQFVLETTNTVHENEHDVIESILLNVPMTGS